MARLTDGFSTTVVITGHLSIKMDVISITPPSVEGGGEIETTTMNNTAYRTKFPKKLKTMGEVSMTVSWEPDTYTDILAAINDNTLVTITFPDAGTIAFYGWMDSFSPGDLTEGERPEADVTFMVSNQTDLLVETAPVIT